MNKAFSSDNFQSIKRIVVSIETNLAVVAKAN